MKQFTVTIYSPVDREALEEHMSGDRDKRIATMLVLMDAMEPGAWFKVERVADKE